MASLAFLPSRLAFFEIWILLGVTGREGRSDELFTERITEFPSVGDWRMNRAEEVVGNHRLVGSHLVAHPG